MNTLSSNKLIGTIGAFTALAGLLLLAAVVIPADPLGRLVGALIGASFLTGLVGAFTRESLSRSEFRGVARAKPLPSSDAAVRAAVAMPRVADATASDLDDEKHPAFAPVVSLTEEQVERARAAWRRQERRAALTRA